MKKTLFNILGAAAFIGVTLTSFQGCKLGDPMEGVVIAVKADAISAAHVFRIVDNKTGATVNAFENATVTLSGPGAASLYDADAKKNFKVVEGRIGICIRRGTNPSSSNPIRFVLSIDAPGYLSKSQEYTLTSIIPTNNTITLVNVNDLPSAASKKDTSITVPSTGIVNALEIKTATTASKTEEAKITLPAGTKFLDANGNPVSGNITASILHTQFKDSTNNAMQTVAAFDNNFKDENGNNVKLSIVEGEAFDISFASTGKNSQSVTPSEPLKIEFLDSNLVTYILEVTKNADGSISKVVKPKTPGVTTRARQVASITTSRTVTTTRFTIKNYADPAVKSLASTDLELSKVIIDRQIALFPYTAGGFQIQPEIDGTFDANITRLAPNPNNFPNGGGEEGDILLRTFSATTPYPGSTTIEYSVSNFNGLKILFGVDCQSGQVKRPVLPEGTQIYLIKESDYQASAALTPHGNKIYPEDNALSNGTVWRKYAVAGLETKNNKVYSVLYIDWNDLTEGAEYRAAYYRAGLRQDNNVNDPSGKIFAPPANSINELTIDMVVPDCD
jgi:hypothetical protein